MSSVPETGGDNVPLTQWATYSTKIANNFVAKKAEPVIDQVLMRKAQEAGYSAGVPDTVLYCRGAILLAIARGDILSLLSPDSPTKMMVDGELGQGTMQAVVQATIDMMMEMANAQSPAVAPEEPALDHFTDVPISIISEAEQDQGTAELPQAASV